MIWIEKYKNKSIQLKDIYTFVQHYNKYNAFSFILTFDNEDNITYYPTNESIFKHIDLLSNTNYLITFEKRYDPDNFSFIEIEVCKLIDTTSDKHFHISPLYLVKAIELDDLTTLETDKRTELILNFIYNEIMLGDTTLDLDFLK